MNKDVFIFCCTDFQRVQVRITFMISFFLRSAMS